MGFVVTTLVVWAAQPATKVATTMPYHAATMLKRELLCRPDSASQTDDTRDSPQIRAVAEKPPAPGTPLATGQMSLGYRPQLGYIEVSTA